MNYYDWKLKNKYYGKYFSIMGDSISTLKGYNPEGYHVFYDDEHCWKAGIADMSDTWWGRVIEFFGGELLVNNSWSGSKVTKLPQRNTLFPCGCSEERTSNLHKDTKTPNVIIIYLGTNDWAFGAKIENVAGIVNEKEKCESFSYAYERMLKKIKNNYPFSEIWCCTFSETKISKTPNFHFPHKHGGIHIEQYNEVIRRVCPIYGCKLIDLYEYRLPYDSIDGSHPTKDGMHTLATTIIREMGGGEVDSFLDCKNDLHEYTFVEANTGWNRYVCTKCGKIYETDILFLDEEKNNNVEYVFRSNREITEIFYTNTIDLTIESVHNEVEIEKNEVIIGCGETCDIVIGNSDVDIDKLHAFFHFQNGKWFIKDNNSTNGTWLNDVKLQQGKNYELIANDVIDFAHIERVIFYKKREDIAKQKLDNFEFNIKSIINGRYEIIKLIEENRVCGIYLAIDVHLNRICIIKAYIKRYTYASQIAFNAMMKEEYVLSNLCHSALPRVNDIIETDDYIIIVLEYVEGSDLREVVKKFGPQSTQKVIEWGKQLCGVLQYLHTCNPAYVHCDVKPANIILMENGNLKLIDFECMKEIGSEKDAELIIGTRGYAPPEQYTGEPLYARTDIFALGMTMHHLLTGVDPRRQSEVQPIREYNPQLSKKLEKIICKCTELKPQNRYQSCEELLKDLNKIKIPDKNNTQSFFGKLFHKKLEN